jgi:hypothetical protein
MNHFATVITTDHIDKSLALLESLNTFGEATLHALVIDQLPPATKDIHNAFKNFHICSLESLISEPDQGLGRIITSRYRNTADELRWALKPIFIMYLQKKFPTLCYLDCDLYFYDNYQFLIDKLQTQSVILTPHWRDISAFNHEYMYNFRHGIYNAGFVGLGPGSESMLTWWAEMCAIECTKSERAYTYVDQRYLDLVPIYFDNVEIIRHYGCNVAGWNTTFLKREREGSTTTVRGMPIVFIHFSAITMSFIQEGKDNYLYDYYNQYRLTLRQIRQQLLSLGLGECISNSISDYDV